jgi:outer membrane biosynthesis protein TonB
LPFGRQSEVSSRINEVPSIIESDPKDSPQSPLVSISSFEYPMAARTGKIEGSLLFAVDIGKDGRARFVETVSDTSASPYLKDFSVEHIRKWNFKPEERFITVQMIYSIAR